MAPKSTDQNGHNAALYFYCLPHRSEITEIPRSRFDNAIIQDGNYDTSPSVSSYRRRFVSLLRPVITIFNFWLVSLIVISRGIDSPGIFPCKQTIILKRQ
jgi:hypothetical protein